MKAFIATDRNGDEGISLVVFAETAGKAKAYAAGTDTFCDYGFTGIRVNRCKALDGSYKGKSEMDWLDADDRVAMVKLAAFHCGHEFGCMDGKDCPAYEFCDMGKEADA